MRLCTDCGQVEFHSSECGRAKPLAKTPEAKNALALEMLQQARVALAEAEPLLASAPRELIWRAASLDALLERYPAGHLTAYGDKRAHNELVTKVAQRRAAAGEKLPAAASVQQLQSDWTFAKRTLELLFTLAARRADMAQFDPSELGKLSLLSIKAALDRATPLSKINVELEQRIQEGKDLDAEVAAWGWKNLRRLMTGKEPGDIPPQIMGGGVSGVFGTLVGRGPQTRRLSALSRFDRLGSRMRERLYCIGAHGLVLSTISRVAQAEDLWTRHLAKDDGTARWAKLKTEDKALLDYFLDSPRPADVEGHLTELATSSPARRHVSLRPMTELDGDEWDGLAKAYFFVFASIMAGGSSRDIGMEGLARKLIERSRGKLADPEARALALQEVRDAWHDRPPREIGSEGSNAGGS